MKRYYPSIQVLRGALFIFILLFHCNVPYANLGWGGGVEAFFIISAFFLVLKQFDNRELDIKHQFKHRITRLYPPYIVVLFIAVLYAMVIKLFPYDIFTHLLSLQNIQWMITDYSSPMQTMTAHTWTLSIEVWAGVIWLILLKKIPKKYFIVVMYGMLILGISYRTITIILGLNNWIVSLCPIAHFDALALGSLLAIKVREGKINRRISIYSVVGVVGILICIIIIAANNQVGFLQAYQLFSSSKNYLNNWFTGNIYFFISLLSIGIIGLMLVYDKNEKTEKKGIIKKGLLFLGDNSYLLYLFHWPILIVVRKIFNTWYLILPIVFWLTIILVIMYDKVYSVVIKKCKSMYKMNA